MSPEAVTDLVRQTLYTALSISAPLLLVAMIVGFGISVFQSVTQINEMTLTFVPKVLIFALLLSITFPWILKRVTNFAINVLVFHWSKLTELTTYTQ